MSQSSSGNATRQTGRCWTDQALWLSTGIYRQRHLAYQRMLRVCWRWIFQRQRNNNDDNLSNTSGHSDTPRVFLGFNYLSNYMWDLLTFFWQTSPLSTSGLPVHQLALRAGGGHRGSPDRIPIITEGVPSAWIPGGGLPQPPLGLGLQTGFLDVAAGQWQPVAVDLVQVSATRDGSSVVFFCRCKVTQVHFLCGTTTNRRKLQMHIYIITGVLCNNQLG